MKKDKIYSIIVTEACNLDCIYCYGGEKIDVMMDKNMAKKICDFILKDASENQITELQILFELGEPLSNFDIIRFIVFYLKKSKTKSIKRIDFTIFTNLQLMNNGVLDFFKRNEIHTSTSLDGPKKIHNFHRGKTFDKTIYWIKKLKGAKIPLEAAATVTRFSLGHYKEIIDLYVQLGLQTINFRVLDKLGFGKKNWGFLGYPSSNFLNFEKKGLLYAIKKNFEGHFIIHRNFLNLFYLMRDKSKIDLFSMPCNTFYKRLVFDSKGDIFTCGEGKVHKNSNFFKIGNIAMGVDLKKIKDFYDTMNIAESQFCKNSKCKVYGICAPCLALNDKVNECNPNRCEILKNSFFFLNNLLHIKKIKHLFLQWGKYATEKRCLYK